MNEMGHCENAATALHTALARTRCLHQPSPQRDALWFTVQATICTRGHTVGIALGSTTEQDIGGEDARGDELVAAMLWLTAHEDVARLMSPQQLFRRLRGVAVRSHCGSARTAQADSLHGMTGVTSGAPVQFAPEAVAS